MMKNPIRSALVLLLVLPLPSVAADAVQGKILYQSNCVRCHNPTQRPFKTPAYRIPDELRSRPISPHRFVLSGTDLDNLVEYLESPESPLSRVKK